jgi:hypothetical protein
VSDAGPAQEAGAEATAVPLRIIGGASSPPGLADDLLRLLALSTEAQGEFWMVLAAYLQPSLDKAAQTAIVEYCERHELTSEQIAPVVKGVRFLCQEVASSGAPPDDLLADLEALLSADDAKELAELVVPWLEDFLPKLRDNLALQAVADHGKVVLGTHWRVDRITSSSRAKNMGTSVAVVTFTYQDGDRIDRVTLHLLPDQVDALRKSADEMLHD